MSEKKSIVISGYYGFDNSGDEAVLAAIVQLIGNVLPKAKLVALSAQPEKTKKELGIEAVNRKNLGEVKTALSNGGLFISGGGSLFQDVTSVRSVYYYSSILNLAHKAKVPAVVLAQGLGPLNTGLGKWLTKRAMAKCAFLSWRDQESLKLAVSLGLPESKQILTCDPVLLWQPQIKIPAGHKAEGAKRIIFAIRPWEGLALKEVAIAIDLLQAKGHHAALLPFHQGVDQEVASSLNQLLSKPAEILPYAGSVGAYTEIANADFLLGMRLHALIMAVATGTPSMAISYDPKVESFAKEANLPLWGTPATIKGEQGAKQILELLTQQQNQGQTVELKNSFKSLWQQPLAEIKSIYEQG